MKKSFLFLADGFEDVEAIAAVDILRRGGVDVRTVSITAGKQVLSAHGVTVTVDLTFDEVEWETAEGLIFPGGMPGAQNLGECGILMREMQRHYDKGGVVAAICAAPALVVSQLKTAGRCRVTCYPGFEKYLSDFEVAADGVVVDGNLITGKGPGFAVPFALAILTRLRSANVAQEVSAGMLL